MHCPQCQTRLPNDARFCIECGTAVRVNTGETVQLPASADTIITCPHCQFVNPRYARFCVYCGEPIHARSAQAPSSQARTAPTPQPQPASRGNEAGIVFLLIGAALLIPLFLRLPLAVWPNILMLLGIIQLIVHFQRGALISGIRNAIWLFGLGFLFLMPRLFFPGLLLLIGLSILLESWRRMGKLP
ncbi:zinc ribbon domain-containing protein [Chloroflexus sp.]|uniref:zinc ribbon domain-containing protein n=1 Tax=Chloroflexus sp. TaxID=1904827 RepID=UPI0026343034|nr:zinc ribbon domain-containing protein [uncultured Chloroflexus sp.]